MVVGLFEGEWFDLEILETASSGSQVDHERAAQSEGRSAIGFDPAHRGIKDSRDGLGNNGLFDEAVLQSLF